MRRQILACAVLVGVGAGLSGCAALPTAAWTAIAAGAGACAAACPPLIGLERDMFDWATGQRPAAAAAPAK